MTQLNVATDQAVNDWVQDHLEHGAQQDMTAEQMSAYVKRIKQLLAEKRRVGRTLLYRSNYSSTGR